MRRFSIAGAALLVLGIAALLQAGRYEFGTLRMPGPGFLPVLAAAVLIAASAWIVVTHRITQPQSAAKPPEPGGLARVALSIAAIAAFPFLLAPLGFLAASTLLLLVLFSVGAGGIGIRPVVLAASAGLACDLLFRMALGVQLPTGTLWGP